MEGENSSLRKSEKSSFLWSGACGGEWELGGFERGQVTEPRDQPPSIRLTPQRACVSDALVGE